MTGLVPELALADPASGRAWLERVLGFAPDGAVMRLGDQRLIVTKGAPDGRHGRVDHLALAVPDLDAALSAAQGRGAKLASATPDGPLAIPEFRGQGVRYAFLSGPEGAHVELIAPNAASERRGPGHDHLGISCAALGPMREFLMSLGAIEEAAHILRRPGGEVEVCFLRLGEGVAEVFSLPETRADPSRTAGRGLWRLRLAGLEAPRMGPEGVEVAPL